MQEPMDSAEEARDDREELAKLPISKPQFLIDDDDEYQDQLELMWHKEELRYKIKEEPPVDNCIKCNDLIDVAELSHNSGWCQDCVNDYELDVMESNQEQGE